MLPDLCRSHDFVLRQSHDEAMRVLQTIPYSNRHDVCLNITFGSFVWQKKKVRSIFSSLREAYPYPARGVKNEAKLVSEKYLCKNFNSKVE